MSKKLKSLRKVSFNDILVVGIIRDIKKLLGDIPVINVYDIVDSEKILIEGVLYSIIVFMQKGFYVVKNGFISVHINTKYNNDFYKVVFYTVNNAVLNSLLLLVKKYHSADKAVIYYLCYNAPSIEEIRVLYDLYFPHMHKDPDAFFEKNGTLIKNIWNDTHRENKR